ncbi:hypothetical protein [Cellvibrio sp. NN19]|uniref:hypothetical protein n=1 Tax=Cellvibrio chitinivorans TaxID=3102792 RepID=UPI002B40CADD|nr:hypothetical protein [Cellvibrio sp. NN19]
MLHEEFDWKVFETRLEAAKSDMVLHNMLHTWGDWEKYYQQYPISPAGWNFIELLRSPVFSRFQNKVFCLFPNHTTVNIGTLATWLVKRANETNSNNTTQELIRYLQLDSHNLNITSVIPALRIEQDIQLDHDLLLTSKIPPYLNFEHLNNLIRKTGNNSFPYSFLIERKTVSSHHEASDDELNAAQQVENYKWNVLSILGLFTERESPAFLGMWTLLESGAPFSGWLDVHRNYYPELKLPNMMEELGSDKIEHFQNTLNTFLNIPPKLRKPIEIGLFRLGQAMNTMNTTQKAIDLGIALECILTAPSTKDQLSFQFRTIGSLLVGGDFEERKRNFWLFKAIYNLRSQAVHNGEISAEEKIPDRGKTSTSLIIHEGIALAQKAYLAIIQKGGLDEAGYTDLMLAKYD